MSGAPDPLEGKTGFQKSTGQRVIRRGGQWVPLNPGGKPQVQEASMRSRMDLGLAPMVQAQEDMSRLEKSQGNVLNNDWYATILDSVDIPVPFTNGQGRWSPLDPLAKKLGGQDYQDYTQASKAFESQLMPIMSGAAVSPSEAARQIKASLPEMGDSVQTLATKARTRAMMLNGAAKARGLPLPYPNLPTWGVNTTNLPSGGGAGASGGVRRYNPKTGRIE